jgi:hypothetical protein
MMRTKVWIKRIAMAAVFLLGLFFTVWVGIGIAMLSMEPARQGLDTTLLMGLFVCMAVVCFWCFHRLRRRSIED